MVELDSDDVKKSPVLKERLELVRAFREASNSPDANAAAATPHLFWWRSQPDVPYVAIPRVVSESRRYFTVDWLPETTIASDALYSAPDPEGLLFSVVSSSMFITWQRAVGGRLKSDLRFSGTLSWNSFPLPQMDDHTRSAVIAAGRKVLDARALYPERSLAQAYHPLAMDQDLVKAHDALDREVDKAFGATKKLTNERQRLELLFASYAELTKDEVRKKPMRIRTTPTKTQDQQ